MTNIDNNIFPPDLIIFILPLKSILSEITINVKYSFLIYTIYIVNVINA